jgi:hypothetical protein
MIVRGDARRIPLRDQTVQCIVDQPAIFSVLGSSGTENTLKAGAMSSKR